MGSGAEVPVDWSSSNEFTPMLPELVFKASDANSGNSALRIISDTATILPPFGAGLDIVAGMVMLGGTFPNNADIPYTDRPDEMSGFVKGTVNTGDTCLIVARTDQMEYRHQPKRCDR